MEYLRVFVFACLVAACVSQEGGTNGTTDGGNGNQNGNFNFADFFSMIGANPMDLLTNNTLLAQFTEAFAGAGNMSMVQDFINSMQNLAPNASLAEFQNLMNSFEAAFPNASFSDFATLLGGANNTAFNDLIKNMQSLNMTNFANFSDLSKFFNFNTTSISDLSKVFGGLANNNITELMTGLMNINGSNNPFDFNSFFKLFGNGTTAFADIFKNMGSFMPNATLGDYSKMFDQMQKSFNMSNMAEMVNITSILANVFGNNSMNAGQLTQMLNELSKYTNASMGQMTNMLGNMTNMLGNMGNMGNMTGMMQMMNNMTKLFGNNTSLSEGIKAMTNLMSMNSSFANMDMMKMGTFLENFKKIYSANGTLSADQFSKILGGLNATTLTNLFTGIFSSGGGFNFGNIFPIKPPTWPMG